MALGLMGATGAQAQADLSNAAPDARAEINKFFDAETSDQRAVDRLRAIAAAEPAQGLRSSQLAQFLMTRAQARRALGQSQEALADAQTAARIGVGTDFPVPMAKIFVAFQLLEGNEEAAKALQAFAALDRELDRPGLKGLQFVVRRGIVQSALALGDMQRAQEAVQQLRSLIREARNWPPYEKFGSIWEANVEFAAALVFHARQDYSQSLQAATSAEAALRRAINGRTEGNETLPPFLNAARLAAARAKVGLGRLSEAEVEIRALLMELIQRGGRRQPGLLRPIAQLRQVKVQQGRYDDALEYNRRLIELMIDLKIAKSSPVFVSAIDQQAMILGRLQLSGEAEQSYRELDAATVTWDPIRAAQVRFPRHRIAHLAASGRGEDALKPAADLVASLTKQMGERSSEAAHARAVYANMLTRSGQLKAGIDEFRKALPVITDGSSDERDDIDAGGTRGSDLTNRAAVLNFLYAVSLVQQPEPSLLKEAFRFAEFGRPDSLQKALSAASARAAGRDPRLAPLIRQEQDIGKDISQRLAAIQAILDRPPEERDAKTLQRLQGDTTKLRQDREDLRKRIEAGFPQYRRLASPNLSTIDDVQRSLKKGELFVAVIVGDRSTFVWAVPANGSARLHRANLGQNAIAALADRIDRGLQGGIGPLIDLPRFDLGASVTLYEALLQPFEAELKMHDRLIVATDGRLAGIPFALLARNSPNIDATAEPLFSGYRTVPWLIRTHSITLVPSATALVTLRATTKPTSKKAFLGFGDPIFAPTAAILPNDNVATSTTFRSALRSGPAVADVAALDPLPDTAEELISMAKALGSDPATSVLLGERATRAAVRSMPLADYRVIAFATHGLKAGDLPGLRSPALALSVQEKAQGAADALLTMEDVLTLKLSAEWVVLSACSTASGAAGSEATEPGSGLARAFFYAGARSVLATAWPVHSLSARLLSERTFMAYGEDSALGRSQALRQAMLHLMDDEVMRDPKGEVVATYGHPIFWAPYIVMGEGGRE